jgi:geranylgeranylglycerol-phosphate geranylgeranyltransferase
LIELFEDAPRTYVEEAIDLALFLHRAPAVEYNAMTMMRKAIAVIRLVRLYTALVAGVVAYALSARGGSDALLAAASLAFLLAGAFAFNDVVDRDADALNVPTRPIPSGALSVRSALTIAVLCDVAALVAAAWTRSGRVVALTCAMVALLFAYSLALERVLFVKNLVMGLIGASVPLFGNIAGTVPAEAKRLAVTIGLFILQKEILADAKDRDGDARTGLRTFPVRFGVRWTLVLVVALNVAFLASLARGELALIAVGVTNIVFAIVAAMRGERVLRAFLVLQRAFLLAGVLFAWRVLRS